MEVKQIYIPHLFSAIYSIMTITYNCEPYIEMECDYFIYYATIDY